MGGESKVTMFSMNKVSTHISALMIYFILDPTHCIILSSCQYISPHMLEKVDKSEYQHEDLDIKKGAGEVDSDDVGEVEKSDDE